jgi:glycerol-3-phosphate dehydrogenase
VLALACDAAARGACAANYVRAEGFLREDGAVTGVRARDLPSGTAFDIRSRVTLNAAGPWLDLLASPLRTASDPPPLAKAVNIVIGRRLFGEHAVGLAGQRGSGEAAAGKRFFFFVPWRGGTMIGTLYLPFTGRLEDCAVSADDLALMTAEVNRLHPAARIAPEEVRFAHVGLLPLVPGTPPCEVDSGLQRRPLVIDGERAWGVGGVLGIRSVKYTSACRIADEALAAVLAKLDRAPAPRREPEALLEPPAAPAGWDGGSSGPETDLSRDVSRRIRTTYGAAAGPILEMVQRSPQFARRVAHDQPTVAAELIHAIREEAALSLCDLVFRRTPLGTFGHPGREALAACAAIAAAELRWDEARREREIGLVEQEYRRLLGGRTG